MSIETWDNSNDPGALGVTPEQVHAFYEANMPGNPQGAVAVLTGKAYDAARLGLTAKSRLYVRAALLFGEAGGFDSSAWADHLPR